MDRTKKYEKAIMEFLKDQGGHKIYGKPNVKSRVVCDTENHQYLLVWTGWDHPKYIYRIWYHLEIVDGKVRVLENKTDVDLAEELEYLGIDRKDMVAAWAWDYEKGAAA